MSSYSYTKELTLPFNEAVEKTVADLKEQGFGILSDIDVKKTLKEKLDVDFKNYRILGACNPPRALKALQSEEEIGLLLPCNVIVYEREGKTAVSAMLPTKAFSIVGNKELEPLAEEVEDMLKQAIDSL